MKTIKVDELESVYKSVIKTLTELTSQNISGSNSFSKIFAPSFFAYGTSRDEKSLTYEEFEELLERQRKMARQSVVEMTVQCTPVFRSYSPHGQAAVYVDELQYLSIVNGISRSTNLRLSIILFKMTEGWRVTHLHASTPVEESERVEILPQKEGKKQNATLEDQLEEKAATLRETLEKLEANRAQLIKQEKLASLGQLTAGIAHEIKNPLNFINNFSELSSEFLEEIDENVRKLESSEITEEIKALLQDVKGNLEKIHQHGTRADGIVKSMLLHSRGGSGKMENTDLNTLIKEYVNLSFHGMRANKNPINVNIKVETDEDLGTVKINPENFSRVVLNLCKNAFDAMREKLEKEANVGYLPQLVVRTAKTEENIVVEFEDNGPGVPEEIREKLMLPFFTTKKGTDGTGLGLSISSDIIKSHDGTLNVESREGEFTRFTILLNRKDKSTGL